MDANMNEPPLSAGGPKEVPLEDALNNIQSLTDDLALPEDPEPSTDGAILSLQYDCNLDTGFVDRNAFVNVVAKFTEEASHQAKLVRWFSDYAKHVKQY